MTNTYTLMHLDRPVETFDARTLAVNALGRAITDTANKLKGYGYSKDERLEEARKVWCLVDEERRQRLR